MRTQLKRRRSRQAATHMSRACGLYVIKEPRYFKYSEFYIKMQRQPANMLMISSLIGNLLLNSVHTIYNYGFESDLFGLVEIYVISSFSGHMH